MNTNVSVITPKSDLGRLNTAVARLRAMGYIVADSGCCASCNWRALREQYPDHEGPALNFHDQSLDGAFGEPQLTDEYAVRVLDAEGDEEALEALYDEACNAGAYRRDEVQSDELWIGHCGAAEEIRRAVSVLREEGLDASWNGDEATNICLKPRWDAAVKAKRLSTLENHISSHRSTLARLEAELCETQEREAAT